MLGDAIAKSADAAIAAMMSWYPPDIVIFLLALGIIYFICLFLILLAHFNRLMNAPLVEGRKQPRLHTVGMALSVAVLVFFPYSLIFAPPAWGAPFPVLGASFGGWPEIHLENIVPNFVCWYLVFVGLWASAALVRSRVAGWSLAAGSAAAVISCFLPEGVDRRLGEAMPGIWRFRAEGFPVDFMVEDNTGFGASSGYPLMFLANVLLLSVLLSPAGLAVDRMLAWRKKPLLEVGAA